MLNKEQLKLIDEYVDEKYYDKEKLIKYLNVHEVVGNEVFDYVDLKNRDTYRKESHSPCLDDEEGYIPVTVDTFVKRIPLYFYTWDGEYRFSEDIGYVLSSKWKELRTGQISLESIYSDMEYMFYEKNIPPCYIFNYMAEQTGLVTQEYFFEWVEYLHLCDELGWDDVMPDNFITAYNGVREQKGLSPIIFTPFWDMYMENPYYRDGATLTFEGIFPTNNEGYPIMKWIGLKVVNAGKIHKVGNCKAKRGLLKIEIQPNTVIYYLDEDDSWLQVYAGPLTMQFDHTILKEKREELGYTQREVAEAVGASIRTYQKWEYGSTQPDGYYLLRLINWLDITNVQDAINYVV